MVTDPSAPGYAGATRRDTCAGIWHAAVVGLTLALERQPPPLLILRADPAAAAQLAGMTVDGDHWAAAARVRTLWRQTAARSPTAIAGWAPGRGYWWGERAAALAAQCTRAGWGAVPATWIAGARLPSLAGTGEDCPVCFDTFSDPLPHPRQDRSRAPPLYECGQHSTCMACDRVEMQRAARGAPAPRCCLCRSDRTNWVAVVGPARP